MSDSIAITSGKGGVGKTTISVNLSIAYNKLVNEVLLLDTDLGMANSHVLLGVNPEYTLSDVLSGNKKIDEIVEDTNSGVRLISGGSATSNLLNIENDKRFNVLNEIDVYLEKFENVKLIVDVAAGAEDNAVVFANACGRIVIVVVGEPTSFMDSYALIKTIYQKSSFKNFCLIINQTENNKVLLGLSGGVDSSVTAALLQKAIGNKLVCVFVDNGLLRKGEAEQVMNTFKENMNLNVIKSDSEDVFLRHLKGVEDPEQKRKIIGRTFIDVFDGESKKLKKVHFLAQGTIYPDVIESSGSESKEARVIKSHHNVGGLPDEMKMDLVEPLRDLFKDEVRKLGVELGLPSEMLNRHPFPGPGLGVRILGEVTKEKTTILKEADHIFIEELIKSDLYKSVSQAFAVYLPVKSVGVVGDERRYAEVIGLRAVETIDFMTARWAHLPYDFLEHVSNRIVNEIEEVSRVVYDISSKPPATIEWE